MRGRRIFRKVFSRRPGGWWNWKVLDESNHLVGSGTAKRQEEAKAQARNLEKQSIGAYDRARENLKRIPRQSEWRIGGAYDDFDFRSVSP